eukprot:GHVS01081499.1.p1 GENE.GHVS01081499.1~~GHVS01081499.1.p1  ORF type:complete len:422 (+),score=92.99 GHVS01081499.1:212-1477(+)
MIPTKRPISTTQDDSAATTAAAVSTNCPANTATTTNTNTTATTTTAVCSNEQALTATTTADAVVDNKKKNSLDELRRYSEVVADTGDFESIKKYSPHDATTNPTLLLQASHLEQYRPLLDEAIQYGKRIVGSADDLLPSSALIDAVCDKLAVNFGCEILKIVPGVVSTEVNASLSFDSEGSVRKARQLIDLYKQAGYEKDRILIKMASTWEGCQAAKQLEVEGIHCNMTLLFCKAQAMAAAEAGATLISPFVGRILDWHIATDKAAGGDGSSVGQGPNDPGVLSVQEIFNYYKTNNYKTIVMGASFRNIEEIIGLCGCDKLTISPKLLQALSDDTRGELVPTLDKEDNNNKNITTATTDEEDGVVGVKRVKHETTCIDEPTFRWMLNCDKMASDKLSDGIRSFNADLDKLRVVVAKVLAEK